MGAGGSIVSGILTGFAGQGQGTGATPTSFAGANFWPFGGGNQQAGQPAAGQPSAAAQAADAERKQMVNTIIMVAAIGTGAVLLIMLLRWLFKPASSTGRRWWTRRRTRR